MVMKGSLLFEYLCYLVIRIEIANFTMIKKVSKVALLLYKIFFIKRGIL